MIETTLHRLIRHLEGTGFACVTGYPPVDRVVNPVANRLLSRIMRNHEALRPRHHPPLQV